MKVTDFTAKCGKNIYKQVATPFLVRDNKEGSLVLSSFGAWLT